jgi:hypothetical protein
VSEIDHSFLTPGDGQTPLLSIGTSVAQSGIDSVALSLDIEHKRCGLSLDTALEVEVEVLVLGGSEGDVNRQPATDGRNSQSI